MPRIRQNMDKYRNEDFARYCSGMLKLRGYQQHDLAVALGVCDATITKILREPEKIPVERLRKIIEFLQLNPDNVLDFCGFTKKQINCRRAEADTLAQGARA